MQKKLRILCSISHTFPTFIWKVSREFSCKQTLFLKFRQPFLTRNWIPREITIQPWLKMTISYLWNNFMFNNLSLLILVVFIVGECKNTRKILNSHFRQYFNCIVSVTTCFLWSSYIYTIPFLIAVAKFTNTSSPIGCHFLSFVVVLQFVIEKNSFYSDFFETVFKIKLCKELLEKS